jgi:glycosyltransferase involved in cell wall biosynthesis
MEKESLVTIGVPTYNSERYIKDCLDSILKQTYSNLEIIVSDNGSTDGTEEIVFSCKDPRIRFNKNPENLYCYGNYNAIINLAGGDLLAIYHSDDVYKPSIVEKEVEFLRHHHGVAAIFTEAEMINLKGISFGELRVPEKFSEKEVLNFKQAYNGFLESGDFLICPSAMFVKEIFKEVGHFKEERFFSSSDAGIWKGLLRKYGVQEGLVFTANDLEMWLKILQKAPVGILHEKLMSYRIHPGQGTLEHPNAGKNFFLVMDYYSNYAWEKNLVLESSWRRYEIRKLQEEFSSGQSSLIHGDFINARRHFLRYIKSPYFFYLCLSFKNSVRVLWALLVINTVRSKSGPFLQKILCRYRMEREKQNSRRMHLL